MKEFRKWLGQQSLDCPAKDKSVIGEIWWTSGFDAGAEAGWRAALEMVVSRRGYMISDFNKEYIDTAVIHKELNGETVNHSPQ